METRKLTVEEVKTIADFVASLEEGQRWLLFNYKPNSDIPIGFSAPDGIDPADLIRIARYLLQSAESSVRARQP